MTKLDKLIELNSLEKQNRKNRLEHKLRQQEYYGEIEELFDPLTKTLNTNSEAMQSLQNKTLVALEDITNVLKVLDSQQESSFLDDRAVTLKGDNGKTFSKDKDMSDILLLMGKLR